MMKGNNSYNKTAKKLVKINSQLIKLDHFKRKMCSTASFVMGFRDNYVKDIKR